jgi:hypothetical protein
VSELKTDLLIVDTQLRRNWMKNFSFLSFCNYIYVSITKLNEDIYTIKNQPKSIVLLLHHGKGTCDMMSPLILKKKNLENKLQTLHFRLF